jgi:transposase-like protein
MSIYPKNVAELMDLFPNEEACLEYLSIIRWPNGCQCVRCDSQNILKIGRGLYRCQVCKYDFSVIAGTLFQDTHKPLRLWFHAIWYIVSQKNGVSALGLQNALGLGSYHTAWEWLHKLRRAMVRPDRDKLSGVIEVNETFVGGESTGKRGRGAEGKTLVLIAAEDTLAGIGRIRMSTITDASGDVLTRTIQQMIEVGSTIRTDGWTGYNGLTNLGYVHLSTTNHNVKEDDVVDKTHLVAALLKRWLIGTLHGAISHKNLPYYLDEFTFRFNRRTSRSRGKLFYRLIEQALTIDPVPAKSFTICSR